MTERARTPTGTVNARKDRMALTGDLRFVCRSLARNPTFVIAAVLSLALGIGANTAIFTIADRMLLRTLPVRDPSRLVLFNWRGEFIGGTSRGLYDTFSYPMYADLRDGNPGVFTGIAARYQDTVDLSAGGPAQRAIAELVSGNFFDVLGVSAAIGRTLHPDDDRVLGGEPWVVLSFDYWQRRFGGSTAVLNRVVDINGHAMTVIGVAQRGFRSFDPLSPADVFVPLMMKNTVTPTWDDMSRRNSIWLKVFARLKPGVEDKTAAAAMALPFRAGLDKDLHSVEWGGGADFRAKYLKDSLYFVSAAKGFGQTREFFAKPVYVLLGMVGLLLLIACVNVANLLITRASGRQKEVAIRLSLGATRGALVRLIMTESLTLAVASGILGVVLAGWISSMLVGMLPMDNISAALDTTPNVRVLSFTAALSLLTALLFGLAPALQTARSEVAPALKNEAGALSAAGGQTRLRRLLVSSQVALSLLLLFGAGLFARSLYNLVSVNTGLAARQLLQFSIDPSLEKYTPQRERSLLLEAQRQLAALPGVESASAASYTLLDNGWTNTVHVDDYHPHPGEDMNPGYEQVLPGFFSTVGAPLIAGREFSPSDVGKPNVVIVNETFVKRYLAHTNPLGHHLGWGGGNSEMPYEIVGVVKDLKAGDIKEAPRPWTFTALLQDEHPAEATFYLRTARNPTSVADDARRVMRRLDPALPVYNLKSMQAQIAQASFVERIFAILSSAFGLFATLLAALGLYGITAHAVTRRTREIGIRIALGAERRDVLQLVMREVLLLTVAGLVVGGAAAIALGRIMQSLLFGMKAGDLGMMAAAAALILVVSAISAWLPARRATAIDPVQSLRWE
ncbi:MAG TPA: ABC transporter permease [Bryobacteraceae bacterium]|nr:ABC transporter permease [Bryobacteraceae bacterium]